MDTEIKKLIEERRRVLHKYYDLPPEERRKADAMFALMERMAVECHTREEFERRFTTRTMYREYNLMLRDFSAYVRTGM